MSEDLRDHLTRVRLTDAAEDPAPTEVIAFRPDWWDGAVRTPAVVVRLRTAHGRARCRLLALGGEVIAVPVASWRARRAIRRLRRPMRVDPRLVSFARRSQNRSVEPAPRVPIVRQRDDVPRGVPSAPSAHRTWPPRLVRIEQDGDAVRCAFADCAGLVPVPPPGRIANAPASCPRCGRPVEIDLVQQVSPVTTLRLALS